MEVLEFSNVSTYWPYKLFCLLRRFWKILQSSICPEAGATVDR